MEWHIRRMDLEDQNNYLNFLGGLIKNTPAEIHYNWLYKENPHGEAITWLVIDAKSERIIGCTSVFPRKVWVRDKVVSGCVGGDTFVDPMFQRRGIATSMHRVSCDGAKEAGIRFQYGFPNLENFGAHLKAGSHIPGHFQEIRLLLRIEPVLRKLRLSGISPTGLTKLGNRILSLHVNSKLSKSNHCDRRIKNIIQFDSRFDRLVEEVVPSFNICCIRDSQYLNWRYFKNPQRVHTILTYEENNILQGFAVLEFSQNTCYLFDFYVKKEDELVEEFIGGLVRFAMSKGSDRITRMVNPRGSYIKNFLHCGFKLEKPTTPLEVLLPHDDRDLDYLTNLENWYLTYGDYDIESLDRG